MELYLAQAPVHDSDCEYSCAVRFAFAEGINKNSRSYARAALIGLLTAAVLFAAAAVLCYLYTDEIIGWVRSLVEKLMSMAA